MNINPVFIAIIIAAIIINKPFKPNKLKSIMVTAKFAQGLARRKLTTAGFDAPFLCNWMDRAKIPWLQALIKNPKHTALRIVSGDFLDRILEIYSRGT
jgi:hypothetical protein